MRFLLIFTRGQLYFENNLTEKHLKCSTCIGDWLTHYQVESTERVKINAFSYSGVVVGYHSVPPQLAWWGVVLGKTEESLWSDLSTTISTSIAGFTYGLPTFCFINTADHDILVRVGQVVANLYPMDNDMILTLSTNGVPLWWSRRHRRLQNPYPLHIYQQYFLWHGKRELGLANKMGIPSKVKVDTDNDPDRLWLRGFDEWNSLAFTSALHRYTVIP